MNALMQMDKLDIGGLKEAYGPLYRWFCPAGSEEKPRGVPPLGADGRKGVARARRAGIVYKSRNQRDRVNARAMKDPRLAGMMDPKALPFGGRRMFWGGFKVMVER